MKKVISFVVAIALVLSMSVCAFAAEAPAADADYDAWVNYYIEVINDGTLSDDDKVDAIVANMPDSKATFYAALDSAVADVLLEGSEAEATFLELVDGKLTAEKGWGLDEAEWEYEVEENLDINIDGFIGDPADGNVAPNVPSEEPDLEEDEDDSDSAGSFLDTILGVLGGLGDILFGGGGEETPEEPSDDNDDPWAGEESTTVDNGSSQVPNQGDTSIMAVATVALVAGAALVLTRKKSEDAE